MSVDVVACSERRISSTNKLLQKRRTGRTNSRILRAVSDKNYSVSPSFARPRTLFSTDIKVALVVMFLMENCGPANACFANLSMMQQQLMTRPTLTKQLFDWCYEDLMCRSIFYQVQRKNYTVFAHLIDPQLSRENVTSTYDPLIALMCKDKPLNEMTKELWITKMLAYSQYNKPKCDVNHLLVFDATTLVSRCVCLENRICSDELFDTRLLSTIIVLLFILFAGFLLLTMYKTVKELQAFPTKTSLRILTNTVS